ncbi:MAG: lytic murein transglycosylase [Candidatus Paceibacterota bacterium]|jgi:membrane-bound lytic murein transglycosylase B/preprotein translocase subunit SecG
MKPSFLSDVKGKKLLSGRNLLNLVNLSSSKTIYLPLKKITKIAVISFAAIALIFGLAKAPSSSSLAQANQATDQERQALESQLQTLQVQMDQQQALVNSYKQKGSTLSSEIKRLEASIKQLNLQIKAVTLNLQKLDREISDTTVQISSTESDLDVQKNALEQTLQLVYENDNEGLMTVILKNPNLSDFFSETNNLLTIKDSVAAAVQKITDLHQKLVEQKTQLSLEKSDVQALKAYQESQKQNIKQTQQQKTTLLTETKGQESKYQQLLAQTKQTAAEIRSRIFKLLGGGEMSFGDAYKIAKMAEDATGVRAAFLLSILQGESALGKNVGQCNYQTAMHPTRDIPVFLKILAELNISPDSVKVSCANSDGVYGGAMGPAQFIPSTWNAYKDRVAKVTGHNPANPWNNADAFVASALYLKDLGADQQTTSAERKAAAKYYAGSRWSYHLWDYGQAAVNRAAGFEDDIKTITG